MRPCGAVDDPGYEGQSGVARVPGAGDVGEFAGGGVGPEAIGNREGDEDEENCHGLLVAAV